MAPVREIIALVVNVARPMRLLLLLALAAAMGSHAQTPGVAPAQAPGKLPPDLARRVEIMIRSRADLSPEYVIAIGDRTKSDVPGYDEIDVVITAGGKSSKPIAFLLSQDGKTLAQFNKFDISQDPKSKVVAVDRPGRGGPANAPGAPPLRARGSSRARRRGRAPRSCHCGTALVRPSGVGR